jgi:tetratricopeptide (TPR) repeat protein
MDSSATEQTGEGSATAAAPPAPVDFFISRRGRQAAIAQEVAQVLLDAGYSVLVQDFDIPQGANFVAKMHEALKRSRHLIVLWTQDYDASPHTMAEVTNFMADAARPGRERRLILLRVDEHEPDGLFAGIVFGDLAGVTDVEERRRRILAAAEGRALATPRRPKLFQNVPPRDLNFTGRDAGLAELRRLFADAEQTGTATRVAIHGMGGVGKSSLAAEYAHRYAGDYGGASWAAAESRAALLASLASLAISLEPKFALEPDQGQAARLALARIGAFAPPFLLIYDNLDTPEALRDLAPPTGVHLIVTSRWADWGGRAAELRLTTLAPKAACELLQKRAGSSDADGAERLAEALGFLPLALDHAGAYCKLTGTRFDAYRSKIDARVVRAPKGVSYPASIAATLGLAVESIAKDHAVTLPLLGFLAFLAPDNIPVDLIPLSLAEEDDRAEALMALFSVSLIDHATLESGEAGIAVHRLVQAATRSMLGEAKAMSSLEGVTLRLAEVFPRNAEHDPQTWPRCRMLLPHVLAAREHLSGRQHNIAAASSLFNSAGVYLRRHGVFATAEPLLHDAVLISERLHGRRGPETAIPLSSLAAVLHDQGDYAQAEPAYREVVDMIDPILGTNHPLVPELLHNFANLLRDTGRQEEARKVAEKAIAYGLAQGEVDDAGALMRLNNLGNLYVHAGRKAQAEECYRKAIEVGRETLGPHHPDIARPLNNLGNLLRQAGRYAEAEELYGLAATTAQEAFGHDHQHVGRSLHNLALSAQMQRQYEKSAQLFGEAIDILSKSLGEDHPTTARARRNLANSLMRMSRYDDALRQAELALTSHAKTRTSERWLKDAARCCAQALSALGRKAEAEEIRARFLSTKSKTAE